MKREFLEKIEVNGVKLTKEAIDSIMDENGKDLTSAQQSIADKDQKIQTLTTERDGFKTQLKDRDNDIKTLRKQAGNSDELNTKLTELQAKYDTDTTNLQNQLSEQSLSHATEKFFSGFKFASELAKKAAISEFKEQNFKRDEKTGEFLGGKDWVENLKKTDPAAFKVEENDNGDGDNGQGQNQGAGAPFFVASTNNGAGNDGGAGNGGGSPFNFNFTGVRPNSQNGSNN